MTKDAEILDFIGSKNGVKLEEISVGLIISMKDCDRALQRLRKAGTISYDAAVGWKQAN